MTGSDSAVDDATIAALREDGSLLRELRDLFAKEAPEQLQLMLQAHGRGDNEAVRLAAHRLKGTAVTFGAAQMQHLCLEIETRARAGALEGIGIMIGRLSAECDRVRAALEQAIDQP